MINRREAFQLTAAAVGVACAGSALAFDGPLRPLVVEPRGAIHADAAVWLDNGLHRLCIWSASAGPVPSVAPGVEHHALTGTVEIEVAGQIRLRRPLHRWDAGHRIALPGAEASLWIQSARPAEPLPVG